MKNKRICKTLSALCLTMVVAFGFTIPAFAQGSEPAPAEDSTCLLYTSAKSQGMKQLMAGAGVAVVGMVLVPLLSGLFSV